MKYFHSRYIFVSHGNKKKWESDYLVTCLEPYQMTNSGNFAKWTADIMSREAESPVKEAEVNVKMYESHFSSYGYFVMTTQGCDVVHMFMQTIQCCFYLEDKKK